MYKELLMKGERVQTKKGLLTLEQVCTLSINELDEAAVELQSQYESSGKKSFLIAKSVKDKTLKMKLDVVLDILETKVEERDRLAARKERKEKNSKILALISEKQDDSLRKKSVKQLEEMLEDDDE